MRALTRRNLTVATGARASRSLERGSAVWVLTLLWLLAGCALPKGKVTGDQHAPDSGPRDAGVQHLDAATGGKALPASSHGGAGGTGGGNAGRAGDAGVVKRPETPKPATPKARGESCASSAECASANCKSGPKGDKRCYGTEARGRDCSGEFDCDGYACVPRRLGETQGVCIDITACGAKNTCQQDHALAFCQLDQRCSAAPMDFVQCFQDKCAGDAESDAGCPEESVEQRLNELGCCPPNGASTGSCATAPQCGCPDDQKCDSLRDGHTACGPTGTTPEGGSCLKDADCSKGFTCRGRLCKRYCDGFDDQSCPRGACVSTLPNGQVEPGIFMCTRRCDPTAPTAVSDQFVSCGPGQGCEAASDGNSDCYTTPGTGTQGAACPDDPGGVSGGFKCAPGYLCLKKSEICVQACKVQGGKCSVGTCISMVPKNYAGSIEIGYCQ